MIERGLAFEHAGEEYLIVDRSSFSNDTWLVKNTRTGATAWAKTQTIKFCIYGDESMKPLKKGKTEVLVNKPRFKASVTVPE